MRARRLATVVTATVAAVLLAAGCTDSTSKSSGIPSAKQAPPANMAGTDKFYDQTLNWTKCGSGQCAKLTVPIDYAKPDGATIQLSVLRMPATGTAQGYLVVNPGGPGGSGVDYAAAADFIVSEPVRKAYDIVGFDPRGVGRSAPLTCLSDRQLDTFLGTDPTPDDQAEEDQLVDQAKILTSGCQSKGGELLAHLSTVDAAKDMDVLRGALGQDKLTYLGKSYGTFLGATYAGLFPKKVGRFVLDGVVAPELSSEELNLGQAKGFEQATNAWAASCADSGDCVLGRTQQEVMQGLRDFLAAVDKAPLTKTGVPSLPELNEAWASTGVAYAMYDKSTWPALDDALRAAIQDKDGTQLMDMALRYTDRDRSGTYSGNIMQVIYAVNCLDRPDSPSLAEHEKEADQASTVAPTWGKYLMWSSLPCGYWPVKAPEQPHKITADGSDLIVVIGTTRDPATPYEWSVMLNDELANSTLITLDGDGHTAYVQSTPNACVDGAVDAYLLKGTAPPKDLKC